MKQEASKFCKKFSNLNKKTVLRCVEEFVKEEKKQIAEVSLIIFKEKGGSEGKRRGRYDIPPKTYCPRDLKAFKITSLDPINGLVRCDECNLEISKREEIIKHIESAHTQRTCPLVCVAQDIRRAQKFPQVLCDGGAG